ncbi:hypothetical protein EGI91_11645 [Stenotrophomonas maltophilia]|nr:hypothetical protein EGI91_11645 [Stenotrophomonas maltophilia]
MGRTGAPPQPASRPIRATDSSLRGRNRLIGSALAAPDSGKGASIPKRGRGGQGGGAAYSGKGARAGGPPPPPRGPPPPPPPPPRPPT